jgi:hypothetical protein
MTLQEFRELTAGMPPQTRIYVLDFNQEPAPAVIVDPGELDPDDPALVSFPTDGLLLDASGGSG